MDEINRFIAESYNKGLGNQEIADKVFDRYDLDISKNAICKRLKRMKDSGTLDFTNDEEVDILQELEEEAQGFFEIGVLDIETTGLWADFGYVLVAIIRNLTTGKYDIFRLDDYLNKKDKSFLEKPANWRRIDKDLLTDFREAYDKYDIIIHFNGRWFDIKFLNTRLIKNELPVLPSMKQLDIYQVARYKLRIRSRRLDALKEFLEIDRDEDGHRWEYWQMAAHGVKAGFDYVTNHCIRDVNRLTEVAKRMKAQINYLKKQ